jgi:hypothetical protein
MANFVDHHEALLIQSGPLVDLEKKVAIRLYEHKSVKPALTRNLLNISKSMDIWKMLQ